MVFSAKTKRPLGSIASTTCMSIALVFVLTLSMLLAPFSSIRGRMGGSSIAYAATSAEKQAEADAAMRRLDEFQTELNQINAEYEVAVAEREYTEYRMSEAQIREDEAQQRITELQSQLSVFATQTYRNGPTSFLEYLFGARSFKDFITVFEMYSRLNSYSSQLIAETKVVRAEAESARLEYTALREIALENEAAIKVLKDQADATAAGMQSEINALKSQAAELLMQEVLAAEAARRKAEEEARRSASGYIDPSVRARVPALVHPCPSYSYISSYYGLRNGEFHLGIDFAANSGSDVLAAASGTVTAAGSHSTMGNYIIISHGNGVRTIYMHASRLYVSPGTWVSAGQTIMAVGSTGRSTGPHLHFQIEIDGSAYNPLLFL